MTDTLLATVLFIVPGFIAASTRRYWSFNSPPAETATESVIWSIGLYLLLGSIPGLHMKWFIEGVTSPAAFFSSPKLLGAYSAILALSVVSGYVSYRIVSSEPAVRALGQSPYETVWDEFWRKNGRKDRMVIIMLSKSTGWAGKVVRTSGYRSEREVWLTNVLWYEDGQLCETACEHLVIACKDVHSVVMLQKDLDQYRP